MAIRVLEVQPTPNPNAAKFVLDRQIAPAPASFFNAESAAAHPLASKLMAVPGVCSILLLGDFVTVNKSPDARWDRIVSAVQSLLTSEG